MIILGVNAFHGDSSACLMKDGEIICATEEERIRRIKHWAGLPTESIKFCLEDAGISLKEVDVVAVSRDPKAKLSEKVMHTLKHRVSLSALLSRGANSMKINAILKEISEALDVPKGEVKAEVKFVEHHRCHMASAFLVSPYEEAAILSIDGMGDFSSTMIGVGKGNSMQVLDSVSYPHSLGMFYTMFTQFLGFPNYGDEYKVMGLAPYGTPKYSGDILGEVISIEGDFFKLNPKYFRHFKEGVSMSWEGGIPEIEALFTSELSKRFHLQRVKGDPMTQEHMDLAASVQDVCEQLIFHMAEKLQLRTGLKHVCLTGGVAQNSVANGKLIQNTGFDKLFVPPAGHDAGTSIGAALYHHHVNLKNQRGRFMPQPYTGAHFSNDEICKFLEASEMDYKLLDDDALFEQVAGALADGAVVGWFQGRAEFGPRALGNRSILVDPRRKDAKDLLNKKIKKRESFRPFAPSILKEYTAEYFEIEDDVWFMEKVFPIKKEKHEVIPAVTHVNGTGRLQTVEKRVNPRYHRLITEFYKLTSVPILLNTSFNENEPIVNSPKHALDCYLRTKMDMLVLGNCIISRM